MASSYTNRKGNKIHVTREHIEHALELYEELKNISPSGKVSWAKLKKMMIKDGYDDADSNETYRQLIKRERSKRGVLPSVKKHAEQLADNKLSALEEEVGEWRVRKREAQDEFLKLNRLKRDVIRDNAVVKEIKDILKDNPLPNVEFSPIYIKDIEQKTIVAGLSDIHYGSRVSVGDFKYDTKMAEGILIDYAHKLVELGEEQNASTIHVVNLGDAIEHLTMRNDNTFSAELTWSEQVIGVSKIIVRFLTYLSQYFCVTYAGINGNHDRIEGNKKSQVYTDGAMNISNAYIEGVMSDVDNFEYIKTEPYHHIKNVNGFDFLFVHGDRDSIRSPDILGKLSVLHNVAFDSVIAGHIHHFTMREVGVNKYVSTFGSIKGSDEYSITIGKTSSRSQGVIIVGENDYEIRKVNL